MTIHLATGIICGGKPTWCGERFTYRESDGVITNATNATEKATCEKCISIFHEAYKAAKKIKASRESAAKE